MKIGFCGAGGTGKTTLAKAVAEKFGIPYIQSPSRACFKAHGVKTEDDQKALTPEKRWALQYDIFQAIDNQVFNCQEGIFDRTHLDNLGYGLLQCREEMSDDIYSRMQEKTIQGLQSFDYLFFAPIYDWKTTKDGIRTQHLASRHLHSNFVRGFMVDHGILYFQLWNKPIENRMNYIAITTGLRE